MPTLKPTSPIPERGTSGSRVCHIDDIGPTMRPDLLAVEEPLEIRLTCEGVERSVCVTMRTPGHDRELAAGFLFSEGILAGPHQVTAIHPCQSGQVVRLRLSPGVRIDLARLERHFYVSSSCGVCGKTSAQSIRVEPRARLEIDGPVVGSAVIRRLPAALRTAQVVFAHTGGLHASALFDLRGNLQSLYEDVGRHNALDKLVGNEFLAGRLPLNDRILLVSGRTSFELVQKAVVAGIPILAAIGAPSSLAVEVAREHGLTLIGFVRADGFNVYTGAERIWGESR